jgi:hypothetical protein
MNTFNMAVKRLGKDFLSEEDPHESEPCLYIDLYRVEDGKIAERWGFPKNLLLGRNGKTTMACLTRVWRPLPVRLAVTLLTGIPPMQIANRLIFPTGPTNRTFRQDRRHNSCFP